MGILPVYLFHQSDPAKKIKVSALLDNASGGTFVNEKPGKTLGIEGSDTDLILTTIHGTHSVTTKFTEGLVVANIKEEDVMLDLPRTFTRNVIPADRSEISRPDVICTMPHLKNISTKIPPYMADIEVGLPLGWIVQVPYVQEKSFTVKNQTRMQLGHSSDGSLILLSVLCNRMARLRATESMLVKETL